MEFGRCQGTDEINRCVSEILPAIFDNWGQFILTSNPVVLFAKVSKRVPSLLPQWNGLNQIMWTFTNGIVQWKGGWTVGYNWTSVQPIVRLHQNSLLTRIPGSMLHQLNIGWKKHAAESDIKHQYLRSILEANFRALSLNNMFRIDLYGWRQNCLIKSY